MIPPLFYFIDGKYLNKYAKSTKIHEPCTKIGILDWYIWQKRGSIGRDFLAR